MRTPLLLAAVSLLACRHPALPLPPPPPVAADPAPPAAETRDVDLDDGFIHVQLQIPAQPSGPKPAVIAFIGEGSALLASGAVTVSYRARWDENKPNSQPPSERTVGKLILASPSAQVLGRKYFEHVAATATKVLPRVVDYLATVPEIDPGRIAITGGSTNGFIALRAVANDPRLAVAAVEFTCADFHAFLRWSPLGMEGRPLTLDRGYDRWLREQSPILHPERLLHAAILLVAGTADQYVPMRCVDSTARVLREAYTRAGTPERFALIVFENQGHAIAERERQPAIDWLVRWLALSPPAAPAR
ncbi:MAG: prolyl oligopeptidase family serine peptidase [Candidatus Binatia bacterium]